MKQNMFKEIHVFIYVNGSIERLGYEKYIL